MKSSVYDQQKDGSFWLIACILGVVLATACGVKICRVFLVWYKNRFSSSKDVVQQKSKHGKAKQKSLDEENSPFGQCSLKDPEKEEKDLTVSVGINQSVLESVGVRTLKGTLKGLGLLMWPMFFMVELAKGPFRRSQFCLTLVETGQMKLFDIRKSCADIVDRVVNLVHTTPQFGSNNSERTVGFPLNLVQGVTPWYPIVKLYHPTTTIAVGGLPAPQILGKYVGVDDDVVKMWVAPV